MAQGNGRLSRPEGWTSAGHPCAIEGCWRPPLVEGGWCLSHYDRWKRYGDPQAKAIPSDFTAAEWFWRSVDKSASLDSCWPWTRYRMANGYGRHRTGYTHRYALELTLGRPLAEGMEACHSCDNPPCCNPAHLFEGTRLDNERDKTVKGRRRTDPIRSREAA